MATTINGLKAKHAIITPNCIVMHGVEGAIDEALKRLRESFMECYTGWASQGKIPEFHVVLTVDRNKVVPTDGGM
jgi:hypothetical protein